MIFTKNSIFININIYIYIFNLNHFFAFSSNLNDLALPKQINLLPLHVEHSNLKVTFLVTLAFFLNTGFFYPPNPFYLISYLLLPYFLIPSLPFLY